MHIKIKGQELKLILFLSLSYAVAGLCGAYLIEYYQKAPPCSLCIYQRFVLGTVIVCFPFVWMLFQKYPYRKDYVIIPLIYLISFVLAAYHSGVEQHIFPAPSQCRGNLMQHGGDVNLLRDLLLQQDIVPCDKVSWRLFGLSMATHNALGSLCLVLIWGYVLWQKRYAGERYS